jgi:hypothetical protein
MNYHAFAGNVTNEGSIKPDEEESYS